MGLGALVALIALVDLVILVILVALVVLMVLMALIALVVLVVTAMARTGVKIKNPLLNCWRSLTRTVFTPNLLSDLFDYQPARDSTVFSFRSKKN